MASPHDNFTFSEEAGWESKFLIGPGVEEAITEKTADLTAKIIKAAPYGPHRTTDAYSIKKNIHGYVDDIDGEWVGVIAIDDNPKARHAMLQEYGYTTGKGTSREEYHEGRRFIRDTLEREGIE